MMLMKCPLLHAASRITVACILLSMKCRCLSATTSWHAYDPELVHSKSLLPECQIYQNSTIPQRHFGRSSKSEKSSAAKTSHSMGLWQVSSHREAATGETLFGFREAMEIIHKNQNPPNCSQAEFMIINNYPSGFGSMVHVESALLSLAIKLGRVYLRNPTIGGYHSWVVENEHCRSQKKDNFECYYEPFSKCTIEDALKSYDGSTISFNELPYIRSEIMTKKDRHKEVSFSEALEQITAQTIGHRTVVIEGGFGAQSFVVPNEFLPILACLPMHESKHYYWWRAVSAAFFMRPNTPTLQLLAKYRDLLPIGRNNNHHYHTATTTDKSKIEVFDDDFHTKKKKSHSGGVGGGESSAERQVIAMYVRRGAKGVEMALKPFQDYADAAVLLAQSGLMGVTVSPNRSSTNTSSSSTYASNKSDVHNSTAHLRSRSLAVKTSSSSLPITSSSSSPSLTQKRVNDKSLKPIIFLGTEEPSVIVEALEWGRNNSWEIVYTNLVDRSAVSARLSTREAQTVGIHHPLEYISMLLNLEYAMKSDAYVCTLMSNWCRLIDELRATIGNRAHFPYVDLSFESCGKAMCVNEGVKMFEW